MSGWVQHEFARALETAATHPDEATRGRARSRAARWAAVVAGWRSGLLSTGRRAPVAGLPAWVTLEVLRGGFATGAALAAGPLTDEELAVARRSGVPEDRGAVFAQHLTDEGLLALQEALREGDVVVDLPEASALLVVAWLAATGDRAAVAGLLAEIAPLAGRLRFSPARGRGLRQDGQVVRVTAGATREALRHKRPHARLAVQTEAVTVWNPFCDALVEHWLATEVDGRIGVSFPDGWLQRSAALLAQYDRLREEHRLCTRPHRDGETVAVLVASLREQLAHGRPRPGRPHHAVGAAVARRGRPGSAEHAALRRREAASVAGTPHHALAQVVADRLAATPAEDGVADVDPLLAAVDPVETAGRPVRAGDAIPPSVRAAVGRARAGTATELVTRGVVPSAEVLAELVPQVVADVVGRSYTDPVLGSVVAATYRAFARRRSLLLTDLSRQVRPEDLPWVRAVREHRRGRDGGDALAAFREIAGLHLDHFPGVVVPNPLVRQLAVLLRQAAVTVPLVEELAADIFQGVLTPKFSAAALLAHAQLRGTVYERYWRLQPLAPGVDLAELCTARAVAVGAQDGATRSVAANGTVIEQLQVLTTHDLAAFAELGVTPAAGWRAAADAAFAVTCEQLVRGRRLRLDHLGPALRSIAASAAAWRQAVFFASHLAGDEVPELLGGFRDRSAAAPGGADAVLAQVVAGLEHAVSGGETAPDGTAGAGRVLLGWSTRPHWALQEGSAL